MSEDFLYWERRGKDDQRLDWRNEGGDWIAEYWESRKHPHRELILNAIEKLWPVTGILELGCSCGPNLANINDRFPGMKLAGIDANPHVIERGKELLPNVDFKTGTFFNLPWAENEFDVVVADAVLMYADKTDIVPALLEINRVAKKGVIFVEWYADSIIGKVKNFHWARNYPKLLTRLGFKVRTTHLTEKTWPNPSWIRNGRVFVGQR